MKISEKFLDLCLTNSEIDVLEGVTNSGKTTTSISTKFVYMVKKTKEKRHLIVGKDVGTVISNIISTGTMGLCDIYPSIIKCFNGDSKQKIPHIKIDDNIVYLSSYADISKWKNILGKQLGAVFIDECNIADMNFIRELFLPRFEYCLMTLNPDNPNKEIYKEFINRCRPIDKYKDDMPDQIKQELQRQQPKPNWHYWFFNFDDNPSMTEERKQRLLNSLLPETREYQTKILGIRTVGTGLIFILPNKNIITREIAKSYTYKRFCCGVDTSYSNKSEDTFALIYAGITEKGEYIVLEEQTFNNKDKSVSLSPSDMSVKIDDFFIRCNKDWGICKTIFIDNADAGTIAECRKFKRNNGRAYDVIEAWKKLEIIDRINLQNGWIAREQYLIVDTCKEHIKEHNTYSWLPDKDKPEDGNDHTINASQYAWMPYKHEIGV